MLPFPQIRLSGAGWCFSGKVFLGEAAFNQRLKALHSDPLWRRLIKFLPLQTVAKRENLFPAIYCLHRRSAC